ncbi:MAG: glycosyl hydrolase [Patescibacteria group bacterium]
MNRRCFLKNCFGAGVFLGGTKVWLPSVSTWKRAEWVWPRIGFGKPTQYDVSALALTSGISNYWWYDWAATNRDFNYIPMVWGCGGTVDPLLNDGRPLFVLNEPERLDQAKASPQRAADTLYKWAGIWRGELYPLGTLVQSIEYVDATIDCYESKYGPWPGSGWAVHAYAGRADWSVDVPMRLQVVVDDLQIFWDHLQSRGLGGRGFVLSECGVLSAQRWHSPSALVPAMDWMAEEFKKLPFVLSWCWFSSFYKPLNSSDLLWEDGSLTELGIKWRELVGVS